MGVCLYVCRFFFKLNGLFGLICGLRRKRKDAVSTVFCLTGSPVLCNVFYKNISKSKNLFLLV